MSKWDSAFCRNGHLHRIIDGGIPNVCKHCKEDVDIRVFSEEEIDKYCGKIQTNQTVLCKNLSTNKCWHEIVPVFDVKKLFEQRDLCFQRKIKVRRSRR